MKPESLALKNTKLEPYEKLATAMYEYLRQQWMLKGQGQPYFKKRPPVVRTSNIFRLLNLNHISIEAAASILIKPRELPCDFQNLSDNEISSALVSPLLKFLRGEETLEAYCKKIGVKHVVTYHYWEKGTTDIPFAYFLYLIDLLTNRLHFFCETIGYYQDLRVFGLFGFKPHFAEKFYEMPWVSAVYLALQTSAYLVQPQHEDSFIAERLSLSVENVQDALQVLKDYDIIQWNKTHYLAHEMEFYTPPNLNAEIVDNFNRYWMSQSYKFSFYPGVHKVEQATISQESFARIRGWVNELSEKIRVETQNSKPETIVQMQWQVFDLCSNLKKVEA